MPSLLLILAQVERPPEGFASFMEVVTYLVVTATSVAGLVLIIKQLREKKEEIPNPLTVAPYVPYVSRPDFDKAIKEAHGRMNREGDERAEEIAAMKGATEALREQIKTEVAEIRRLVEAREVSGEARANRINDRIDTLGRAVAEMPDRLFVLIRNAKNI